MNSAHIFAACMMASGMTCPPPAMGQVAPRTIHYSLKAQPLDRSLTAVARLAGRQIIVDADATAGKQAPRLIGQMTVEEAIRRLIADTGLVAEYRDDAILIHAPLSPEAGSDIVVTGSRIRGAISPSPVHVVTAKQIVDAGQSDLGDVARTLPQSFGGGQNPEIGIGVTGPNMNTNAASSLNLRGLGADATLTLLNGHRLSYDGTAQGVDISSIPVSAVDRIEIVPDGASALYGSDAVGGVANVILKRDYRGLDTSARIDVPTGGGGIRQLYTATAGTTWGSGGGLVTADIDHAEPIVAGDRDVTRLLAPTTTLVRRESHQGVVANLHQELVPDIAIEMDALYSYRSAFGETPYGVSGPASSLKVTNWTGTRSAEIAPRVVIDAIPAWQVTLDGVYGEDRARYRTVGYSGGVVFTQFSGCLCNRLASVEASAEGRLFDLPGGPARLALGGGVRRASLHYSQVGGANFRRDRITDYAYGELAAPLVSAQNASPGLRELLLSFAGRYERYHGSGVLSPKFGAVYSPWQGVDLKGTWGRSFKAPTLYQQFSPGYFDLLNAADAGYPNYPAGSTIALLDGGNATLKPERAQTWSATLALHPKSLAGFHLELSYFDVDFKNRVQIPVQSLVNALGNPDYASFITYAPTADEVAAAIAGAAGGLDNQTGRPFDPAQLVAIIDMEYRNVTREHASGVDFAAGYRVDRGEHRAVDLSIDASYLTSRRTIIPTVPSIPLAGTLFSPPRLRGRIGTTWSFPNMTLAAFANYVGGVDDRRSTPTTKVHGQTTVDLSARLALAKAGALKGTELSLSVRNLFDAPPDRIATSVAYATPYDSTNYSAIGRVIGLQVSRKW